MNPHRNPGEPFPDLPVPRRINHAQREFASSVTVGSGVTSAVSVLFALLASSGDSIVPCVAFCAIAAVAAGLLGWSLRILWLYASQGKE